MRPNRVSIGPMVQNGPEKPKLAASMRWFIWAVATLIAINFLIFWKLVVSPGSGSSAPGTQPVSAGQKSNSVVSGSKQP